jgi:hypothetical protein
VLEQLEEVHRPEVTRMNRELEARADQCEIMVMSVKEWLKEQARRMKIDPCSKSDQALLKEVCEVLTKKRISQ